MLPEKQPRKNKLVAWIKHYNLEDSFEVAQQQHNGKLLLLILSVFVFCIQII